MDRRSVIALWIASSSAEDGGRPPERVLEWGHGRGDHEPPGASSSKAEHLEFFSASKDHPDRWR
jgi:hypothetical protein